jgi:flavorubredoxin
MALGRWRQAPVDPIVPSKHYEPVRIAPDTFLIRQLHSVADAPISVYFNSLVIRGKEPVVVDTGTVANRERWMKDVFSIVEPKDVRWIYISHDDHDHTGNLREVMELCPNATLVGNWFMVERLVGDYSFPLQRMRWVEDGDSLDIGDRTLAAIRPPVFDSPVTRGLYDPKTGVYWGSDAFSAPVIEPSTDSAELDGEFFQAGFIHFQQLVSPWLLLVDEGKFNRQVDRLANLDIRTIAMGHGPAITGSRVGEALDLMRRVPSLEDPIPVPGQAELEAIVAGMIAGEQAA